MKRPLPTVWPAFYRVDPELEGIGPRLNFIRRDELNDPRPIYTKQSLEQLASGLGEFCRDRPVPTISHDPPTPAERFEMMLARARFTNALAATVLRELANNADALESLNRRPAKVDGKFLGINRAVHYHVLREVRGSAVQAKVTQMDVAASWSVEPSQVKDDYTGNRAAAVQIVESIVEEAMRHPAYETREAVLDALAEDMDARAHRCASKRRRIKKAKLSA